MRCHHFLMLNLTLLALDRGYRFGFLEAFAYAVGVGQLRTG
jgi:hypothetical protein